MKSKECMNCGSTHFHKVEQGWKCDYCGTIYLKPQKQAVSQRTQQYTTTPKKPSRKKILALSFAILLIIGAVIFILSSTTSYEPIDTQPANSQSKGAFPGEWTSEIYNSIKVATEHYDADSEKYSFEGGASYEELEKLVGPPDRVTSWEKEKYGMPPRSTATWDQTKDGEYANGSVTITYDKQTKMITDKSRY